MACDTRSLNNDREDFHT